MAVEKKALVIVESPSKAKTIQKYLGRSYIVKASVGHVKDLPKSKLGVDPDKKFEVDYQVIPNKVKVLEELKKFSDLVPVVYLATDPDREGEAIAWHIQDELKTKGKGKKKKFHRVLFNSVTKPAILDAMKNPLELDENKYNAQQARRVLDRLVGYKISPILWEKVRRGISAGRVQSVALRIIVEREKEIKAFKAEEYWKLGAVFSKDGIDLATNLFKIDGKDYDFKVKKDVDTFLASVKNTTWTVGSIEQKERSRRPVAPFITSRLQQESARKLGFSAKKTMGLAQRLYEGVDLGDHGTHGLITYMRTDSTRVEPGALQGARQLILSTYGFEYVPEVPNVYKSKKSAQDAHEAIRPSSMEFTPELVQPFLEKDEFRLYQLIWNRFVSSQMTPAVYDLTGIDIVTKDTQGKKIQFRATGSVLRFAGFTKVYSDNEDELTDDQEKALKLPNLKVNDPIDHKEFTPTQHFTQPPPRYADASLIRDLEEKGIGRPSTYATILSNLQDREYVEKREARFYPSELGVVVSDLLVQAFPEYINSEFTSDMENKLDEIEEGKQDWKKTLGSFWKPFEKSLERAKKSMKDVKRSEVPTDIPCDKCKNLFVIKWGRMGSFLACSNYPECTNTQDFKKDEQGKIIIVPKEYSDKKCGKCEKPMVVKSGKFGKFLACSDYPTCKSTAPFTIGIKCPSCPDGDIAQRQSRFRRIFYSCETWPKCAFALWDKPVQSPCPQCKFPLVTEKITKKAGLMHKCHKKECGWMEVIDPDAGKPGAESPGSSEYREPRSEDAQSA